MIAQLVAAPAGWFSVHADQHHIEDKAGTGTRELVTLRPVAAIALVENEDGDFDEPVRAIVARDYGYGGVPDALTTEREHGDFVGYLAPGIDLELFRGAVLDHYERRAGVRPAA